MGDQVHFRGFCYILGTISHNFKHLFVEAIELKSFSCDLRLAVIIINFYINKTAHSVIYRLIFRMCRVDFV